MKRFLAASLLLAFSGPCMPDDYFSDLAASAGSAIASLVLTDFVNVLLMR
jgi:hypothetical protein